MFFANGERGRSTRPLVSAIALLGATAALAAIACSSDSVAPLMCTSSGNGELVVGSDPVSMTVSTSAKETHVHIAAYGALYVDKRSTTTKNVTTSQLPGYASRYACGGNSS